jgi:hypothetical protein
MGFALVLAVAAAMLAWTWGTWPQLLVDFGRELYVAWRLAAGDILYRDIAYFNGPLSPYVNATWFRWFGPSLRNLVALNLLVTLGTAGALHALLSRIAGRSAALAGTLAFVLAFAFNHVEAIGNDTFVAPYSHEATHGMLLSLLALLALARPNAWSAAASGLACGLVFLTKAEIFLALVPGVGVALFLGRDPRGERALLRDAALLVAAALVPVLVAVALLARALPLAEAIRGALGSWTSVFRPEVSGLYYYRDAMGLVGIGENLSVILVWSAGCLAYAVLATGSAMAVGRTASMSGRAAAAVAVTVYLVLAALPVGWIALARALPVLLAILLAIALARACSGRTEMTGAIPFLIFGFLLLAKIAFRVRLDEYGFVLAMPASLALVCTLVEWWPRAMPSADARRFLRAANIGALLLVATVLTGIAKRRIEQHHVPIGSGGDRFLATDEATTVAPLLDDIEKRIGPDETLAVLPEGIMINYLARRVNPTGHLNFMPPEFAIFGEAAIERAFADSPPDWVVLVSRPVDEYGMRGFGADFGVGLSRWVGRHYQTEATYGAAPDRWPGEFGLALLRRNGTPRADDPR